LTAPARVKDELKKQGFGVLAEIDVRGTMLPCNLIVQERAAGRAEAAATDPMVAMQAVGNPRLSDIAGQVQVKLKAVIAGLAAAKPALP